MSTNRVFSIVRGITRRISNTPERTWFSNRIAKPIWCSLSSAPLQLDLWNGVRALVDPRDCIGGNLAFCPDAFDPWERAKIADLLPDSGTFVDVGAHIGAYSLWAASLLNAEGRVVAFEPSSGNYASLVANIKLNNFQARISAVKAAAGPDYSTATLRMNVSGNSGGHSLVGSIAAPGEEVQMAPLADLLLKEAVDHVDVMKIDIEGFELPVLHRFFDDCDRAPNLRPSHILIELAGGPTSLAEQTEVLSLLSSNGYEYKGGKMNALLSLTRVM